MGKLLFYFCFYFSAFRHHRCNYVRFTFSLGDADRAAVGFYDPLQNKAIMKGKGRQQNPCKRPSSLTL
jgi:hypothetical protein